MRPLRIVHLFPDLLNLYGDGGNVRCLQKRCEWRGIPVEVISTRHGESVDLGEADIVFLGGGPDREQRLAADQLLDMRSDLAAYVESGGVLLAICGGYQILGTTWLLGDESVEGLGLIDMVTRRSDSGTKRLVGDIVLDSPISTMPVVGYENHAGRSFLGEGLTPFGKVISSKGYGNNDTDKHDGVLYKNVVGTYLHGPLLAKNPQVADYLLAQASEVRIARGDEGFTLTALDDAVEQAANDYLVKRFGIST